ncbi:MAG: tetratricopeptide repeat protein [Chromatiales bacterium]|nr:MAG: tetratricopeptide repeat protein [Chromatiales bacterium]
MLISRAITTCCVLAVSVAAMLAAETAHADNAALFDAADLAAKERRLGDMERAYDDILATDPTNVRALSGKAAALAWTQRYREAQATYQRAIAIAPGNADNHVGLGYAYAWHGDYPDAHAAFREALRLKPNNLAAHKGIAYSYMWSGEQDKALTAFQRARTLAANDAEIAESSGIAALSLGRTRDAVDFFDEALRLQPDRSSARNARRNAYRSAPSLESTVRLGSTTDAGAGFRYAELAHWLSKSTRIAVRYDNTLGLDNPSVTDRDEDVPGYFASVRQSIGSRWQLIAELGRRDLPAGDQDVLGLQAHYRMGDKVLRVGGELGRHDEGHSDRLVYAGINVPLGESFSIDPTLYLSQTGVDEDSEWRGVVNVEYRGNPNWTTGVFAGGGTIDATDPASNGSTFVAGAWANFAVADRHTLHFLVRREDAPSSAFTVAEVGFTYRLPGN